MWTKVLFTKLEEPKILNALIEFTFIQWLGYNDDITIVKSMSFLILHNISFTTKVIIKFGEEGNLERLM